MRDLVWLLGVWGGGGGVGVRSPLFFISIEKKKNEGRYFFYRYRNK